MTLAPIRYTLSFPHRHQHYVEVAAEIPCEGPTLDLFMASWTPGSYMIREYARHVEGLTAGAAGTALTVHKLEKNRWRVETKGAKEISLRYRVYGREMTVRTNWIESELALLNGAPTFISQVGCTDRPHHVRLLLPADWRRVVTALPLDEATGVYVARDYDTLVDSPIGVGNPAEYELSVSGKDHLLASFGEAGLWDGPAAARDIERIVAEQHRFWGVVPYERYVFLNAITEGRGGLEHMSSAFIMASRWAFRVRKEYLAWLGVMSHELFHVWNVKRLRPRELGPFDYEREAYTPSLWMAEGCTAYYDDLLVHRAGLSTRAEYLDLLSKNVEQLQTTPGRKLQPLDQSSIDAWIKQYRPDENSGNTAISYYTKGAVLCFLLDARLRRLSSGKQSLDHVLRRAYAAHSGARGYAPEELLALVHDAGGAEASGWLEERLRSTSELDYGEALACFGLRWKAPKRDDDAPPKGWLGVSTKSEGGRLVVSQVARETPAYLAGINADDELLAIDDFRVTGDALDERLKQYPPGTQVSLLVARRQRLMRLELTTGQKPADNWKLEEDPTAGPEAKASLAAWLGPSMI